MIYLTKKATQIDNPTVCLGPDLIESSPHFLGFMKQGERLISGFQIIIFIQIIKEGIALFVWIYLTPLWLYTDHQRKCFTMNLNFFPSELILCRPSKKVLHNLFECICFWRDSIQSIKESVPTYILMVFLWYNYI